MRVNDIITLFPEKPHEPYRKENIQLAKMGSATKCRNLRIEGAREAG
jgi:hypothetical protein